MPSFQLFQTIRVKGAYRPQPLPPFRASATVDGYRFTLHGTPAPARRAGGAADFKSPARTANPPLHPWFGALAHAIFFRAGSLDYFHTHVCAPGAAAARACSAARSVTGTSATPGRLNVGVLLPVAGTWRLFLQCRLDGKMVTAPFTLHVS